jgi:hypothetical protein
MSGYLLVTVLLRLADSAACSDHSCDRQVGELRRREEHALQTQNGTYRLLFQYVLPLVRVLCTRPFCAYVGATPCVAWLQILHVLFPRRVMAKLVVPTVTEDSPTLLPQLVYPAYKCITPISHVDWLLHVSCTGVRL